MKDSSPSATPIVRCTADGCQWHVLPDWESSLLTHDGLRMAQWLTDGRAKLLQQRVGRAIYVVHSDHGDVYVKQQRVAGPLRGLANLVRGSAARREWNATIEARRRGIATAQPVAFGEQRGPGGLCQSWFVTQAVAGAEPLDRLMLDRVDPLPPHRRRQFRRRVIDRLARFVAHAHRAGLRHPDFHAGNMLVVAGELDDLTRPAIYLIDLSGARFAGPLDWPAARDDFVVLHAEWFDRSTVAERWRFLKTYLAHRPDLQVPTRDAMVDQLDHGARAHSRRIDRRRDRRALATNRDFVVLQRSGRRFFAVAELPEPLRQRLWLHPESLLYASLDRPVKISHTTLMVSADLPLGDRSIRVALKRCRPRNAWKSLVDRFRCARAERGWRLGHALVARRIATARPLAACDTTRPDSFLARHWWSRWLAPREGYLAVEWIEGAENLHLWAWRVADRAAADRFRRAAQCAESLGRLLGRMHSHHVSHRDLKGSNLLVADSPDGPRTWLIDTDGVRIHARLSAGRRAADLARLATSVEAHPWVSRTVRWRFLRAYAAQFPRGSVDPRSLWKSIAPRSQRQIARKRRQGKPIL